jgi:hypothetical protein
MDNQNLIKKWLKNTSYRTLINKYHIEIEQSTMPWNCWLNFYDDDGRLCWREFFVGGYYSYLKFLKDEGFDVDHELSYLKQKLEKYN